MHPRIFAASNTPARGKSAFTLIELLVVIAIVSLIAAILFPVFSRARENARKISCLSNLKQVAIGFNMYAQDNDEFFVRTRTVGVGSWIDSLLPYTKNLQIFRCPSATQSQVFSKSNGTPNPAPQDAVSYSVNATYQDPPDTIFGNNGLASAGIKNSAKLSAIEAPTTTVFAGDSMCGSTSTNTCFQVIGNTYQPGDPPMFGSVNNQGVFVARHLGGANMVFIDGHAKWFLMEKLLERSNNGSNRFKYFTARDD